MTNTPLSVAEVVTKAKERADLLRSTGEIYTEITAFFEDLSTRRYDAHKASATNLTMAAARTAMDLRSDYRRLSRECIEDAEIYDRLCAATLARAGDA